MARLHTRISLYFLGVLLIAGVVASAVFAVGARSGFVRDTAERVARHVAALAGERFGDPAALRERLRQVNGDLGIDVAVRDLDGRVVAEAGRAMPALGPAQASQVRSGRVIAGPRPVWHAAAPVRDPRTGAIVGTVETGVHRHVAGPRLLWPALWVAAMLLIVAVATSPLARRISRPIEQLTEAARRLGQGDLAYRVPGAFGQGERWRHRRRPADEIAELTRSFNDMADRVERLVRGQKELLTNVSHELRSPLARIRVALALLPREGDSERLLRDVEADLSELDRLIEDVLTTARLDATGLPVHLATVQAQALMAQLAERARHDPLVGGRDVRLAPATPVEVIADAALLRRAVWNLIENAAKYGAPPITLAVERDGDRVSFCVSDEGQGIAPAERERVTEPFYRGDRARTPMAAGEAPRGVGLGLTLARRVALVHGGTVSIGPARVDAGHERGCRVAVVIPVSPPVA